MEEEHRQSTLDAMLKEQFAGALMNTAQLAIIVLDAEGRIVRFSPYFEAISGYKLEEVAGKDWFKTFLPADECLRTREVFRQVLNGHPVRGSINSVSAKDGSFHYLEWNGQVLRDAQGDLTGLLYIGSDVTERIQTEEALRRQAGLIDISPDANFVRDFDGRIRFWSNGATRLYGWSAEEAVGRNSHSLLQTQLPESKESIFAELLQTGKWSGDLVHRTRDGEQVTVRSRWLVHHNAQENISEILESNVDITARKQAEEALRQSREDLARAQEVGQIGSWRLDSRNILKWSDENYRIFGVPTGTLPTYETFLDAVHPEDRLYVDARWKAALSGEKYDIEHRIVVNGEVKWVRDRAFLEFDKTGKLIGALGVTQDITDRRRTEEQLKWSARRNELLSDTAAQLLQSENPQILIEELCREVMEFLDCHAFFNFLVDEGVGRLHLNAYAGIPEEEANKIEWLDYGVAVCGCVAQNLRPILAENIAESDDSRTALVKSYGIQAYCCHPLMVGGKLIGTLSFGSCSRPHFSLEDVAVMKSVTDLVSMAMHRIETETVLRQALAKAEEGDRMLSALMEYVPEGITIADADLNLRRVSRYGQDLLGIPHEGKTTAEVVSQWRVYCADGKTPMSSDEVPLVRAIKQGEVVQDAELVQVNSRGERLPLLCTAGPIRNATGRIIGGVVAWRNITERKRTEMRISRQNRILNGISRIFEQALTTRTEEEFGQACLEVVEEVTESKIGFIAELNQNGLFHVIAISNPGWNACRIFDSAGQRRPVGNFKVNGIYGRVVLDGKGFFTNDPSTHPDSIGLPPGHPPLSAFLGVPLEKDGKVIGMVAVGNREGGYDKEQLQILNEMAPAIVEAFSRKRAEDALLAHRQLLQTVINYIPASVNLIRGSDLRIQLVNPAYQAIAPGKEMIGKTLEELWPEAGRAFGELCRRVLESGEIYHAEDDLITIQRRPDGPLEQAYFTWSLHRMRLPGNEGWGILNTAWETTARKQAEELIRISLAEKEVLLKEIHHRVKNNMQVISSLVALQADEMQDAAMRIALQDLTHRVRSMAIVHEKLYQSADLASVEFDAYTRSLLDYLWRAYGTVASRIDLNLDLEPVFLPVNLAVPCGLILNELVGNALKHAFHGRNKGKVTVLLEGTESGQVRVSVRDDGTGLPEKFDLCQTRSLGLRLVQMLAGQLHASVSVSNDQGTEFAVTFDLPRKE